MRKLVIAFLVLIIVVAALLGWALYNIDSVIASYKDRIIAAVERHSGRKVAFERISVKLRGGAGVRILEFSIAEDPDFGAGHFLQAADVRVDLKIRPLQRQVSVTRVVLRRPVIQVIRDARGVYNFSGLGARGARARRLPRPLGFGAVASAFAASEPREAGPAPTLGVFAGVRVDLAIARVEVSGGTLDYRDDIRHHRAKLGSWDLNADDLRMDRPFKANIAAAFLSDKQNVRFKGTVGPLGKTPTADAVPLVGSVDIGTLPWDALRQAFPRMDKAWPAALEMTGNLKSEGLSIKGTLKDLELEGTLDLTDSGVRYADLLNKPRGTALRIGTDARLTPGGIAAKRLDATLDTLILRGSGDLDYGSPAVLDLSLSTANTEMAGLDRWLPPLADYGLSGRVSVTAGVTGELGAGALPRIHGTAAFRRASARLPAWEKPLEELSAAVEFSGQRTTFRQLSVRIGQTRLAGNVTLESVSPLTLTYRLASPSLRLADLEIQPAGTVLENARGSGRLRRRDDLSWEGNLTSAGGQLLGLAITDLSTGFALRGFSLALENFRFKTLGGSLDANGRVHFGGRAPRFEAVGRLRSLDIRRSLYGIAGIPDVEGSVDADLSVTGQGATWAAIGPTLQGTAKAAVVDGRVLDFNLAKRALQGITGIKELTSLFSRGLKDKYPHIFEKETTAFEQIDTELRAVDGRIVVDGIALKAKDYDIAGKGWVKLDGDTNLEGVLKVSEVLSSDLWPGSRLTPLTNENGQIEVPFTLRGALPAVKVRPRLSFLQRLLEKSVGRGVQGLLGLIPGTGPKGGKETETETRKEPGKEPGEKPEEKRKDPIQELIRRTLKLFGDKR